MGRTQVLTLPAGIFSNPYHRGKAQVGEKTRCETCDRVFMSRDWPAHQNSKGHRKKKELIDNKENRKTNTTGTNGADTWAVNASGFTPDAGFDLGSPDSGSGNPGSGNTNGGSGGSGACFNCGLEGYFIRSSTIGHSLLTASQPLQDRLSRAA